MSQPVQSPRQSSASKPLPISRAPSRHQSSGHESHLAGTKRPLPGSLTREHDGSPSGMPSMLKKRHSSSSQTRTPTAARSRSASTISRAGSSRGTSPTDSLSLLALNDNVSGLVKAQPSSSTNDSLAALASLGPGGSLSDRNMLTSFIQSALLESYMGKMRRRDELIEELRRLSNDDSLNQQSGRSQQSQQLARWLEALSECTSKLDKSHRVLVDAILTLPWFTWEEQPRRAWGKFTRSLVLVRSEWLGSVLERAVKSLRYNTLVGLNVKSSQDTAGARLPRPSSLVGGALTRREVYDRQHGFLHSLCDYIPTLPSTLAPILQTHFPPRRERKEYHMTYYRNVLRVIEYCPDLLSTVLGLVISKAVKLDAEITQEVETLADDEGKLSEQIFQCSARDTFDRPIGESDDSADDDSNGSGDEAFDMEDLSDDEDLREEAQNLINAEDEALTRLKETVTKLDCILREIFAFLTARAERTVAQGRSSPLTEAEEDDDSSTASESEADDGAILRQPRSRTITAEDLNEQKRAVFDALLTSFDTHILQTFNTRHVQFLLFWSVSLSPEYTDDFTGALIERILFKTDAPNYIRVASAAYLGSFVSRAKFFDQDGARTVVRIMCQYISEQLSHLEPTQSGYVIPAYAQYTVFYAVVQAVMYIFCFRWRELLLEDEDPVGEAMSPEMGPTGARVWPPELDALKAAVDSPLNPLAICSAPVVEQFARISHSTGLMYCYTVLETNKRHASSSTSSHASPTKPKPGSQRSVGIANQGPVHNAMLKHALAEARFDTHFPFDPFKLPLSGVYVNDLYREWRDESDDTEDEDDVSEMEQISSSVSTNAEAMEAADSVSPHLAPWPASKRRSADLGSSFGAMSLSPEPFLAKREAAMPPMSEISV
ncbi:uncharacterized protein L969DRAFT_91520 [Mixia osmundae IAM 14324]|uniref:RNA polymerase I-specific transcription initiation factor RRN3 n=1 Tax=Mixia osmundae (strain CBS 9802 / IAM 14324 / JCM 22182 / KY 12970) TaxID=764103 RepID=G7DVB2_MIXOS|nr:uncharacterized protein L969DRAFT_91520 [Mixia osmundae IAM 14324]KEI42055.1 hypothetical protein L969DRAFT_91520 [Mixia osmundae IAM 14324]GAA94522.1 hypothetical protein E5Q_01174 [Mixia osmundae IAM 14324]